MIKNTITSNPTSTSGNGELSALLKVTDSAMPVVATPQLVVVSSRVRQILLRYISPLYKCATAPNSAALNVLSGRGFDEALMSSSAVGFVGFVGGVVRRFL